MTDVLARMGSGFADPVHGAQQAFRTLLEAMARPGRVQALPEAALEGLRPADADLAPPVGPGLAATLLALLDAETPVLLAGALGDGGAAAWARFHTGARAAADGAIVAWAAARAADVGPALLARLAVGTDESPQDGATLVVEVDGLDTASGIALALRGPGVESVQRLRVAGLPASFWDWRRALQRQSPRGVDLLLVHGARVAAIPRSTRLEIEGA
ncbi:MAG: phosphonate C-P lyase system protein PhnH [Burkholderiaceae bacterium]